MEDSHKRRSVFLQNIWIFSGTSMTRLMLFKACSGCPQEVLSYFKLWFSAPEVFIFSNENSHFLLVAAAGAFHLFWGRSSHYPVALVDVPLTTNTALCKAETFWVLFLLLSNEFSLLVADKVLKCLLLDNKTFCSLK